MNDSPPNRPTCLVLQGIADDRRSKCFVDRHGKIRIEGSGGINALQALRSDRRLCFHVVVLSPVDHRKSLQLPPAQVILNEISDADSHRQALKTAERLRRKYPEVPCVNEPAAVLATRRDEVFQKLESVDGVCIPKTIREPIEHPEQVAELIEKRFDATTVLMRQAGDHGGISTIRLRDANDLELLARYPLDGREYYFTAFQEFQSPDSLYRKYRIAVVDGRPHLRHLIISDRWLIHAASRKFMEDRPDLQREESNAMESFSSEIAPRMSETIRQVADRLGLDYFGIDCAIGDDGLTVFEANANMNLLVHQTRPPNRWHDAIDGIRDDLADLLLRKVS